MEDKINKQEYEHYSSSELLFCHFVNYIWTSKYI